jgi:DNA-binding transcriptional ArsR family regulator
MSGTQLNRALKNSASIFAALGDQTRLSLVARLSRGEPLSITCLSSGANVTRQAITKHLHVLAEAGVVRGFRNGREQLWQLERRRLDEARDSLEIISRQWDGALARLKSLVEEDSQ